MGHVVRDAGWCVIDINTTTGRVFLQERWKYQWKTATGVTAWTTAEKRRFHSRADRAIWAAWSNRASLKVTGASKFAKRFGKRRIPINLDVRWVLAKPHWNVAVTKVAAGTFKTSSVRWTARTIKLDTNDFKKRTHCNGPPKAQVCTTQVPVAHEFGHAAGNTKTLGRGDEYKAAHAHHGDQGSILHSGSTLRSRHFLTILDQMNKMIPGTVFSVASV